MSATFKNAKKQLIQSEFRKYMKEYKKDSKEDVKQINSPLAKYNEKGDLTCVLCKSVVRSAAVWPVHLNSKQHRQNIEVAKKLKERTNNFTQAPKRSATPPPQEPPQKKVKSILKNSTCSSVVIQKSDPTEPESAACLPKDFFDNFKNDKGTSNPISRRLKKTGNKEEDITQTPVVPEPSEVLPEGFFDDPKLDAKARNQEYKDPIEEEWERFQKEIKEADDESAAIIAEDQEEATTRRIIELVDEDIKNFSKVLDFVKKKPQIKPATSSKDNMDVDSNSDLEEDEIEEFIDWRAKRIFKN